MTLEYLDFDYSEDTEGVGVFDAMASIAPAQVAALHAEIVQVLDWAHATFPGRRGVVGEDGDWDYDLQAMQEITQPEAIEFDQDAHRIRVRPGPPATPRHTVTISVSGSEAFCAAFRDRFAPD